MPRAQPCRRHTISYQYRVVATMLSAHEDARRSFMKEYWPFNAVLPGSCGMMGVLLFIITECAPRALQRWPTAPASIAVTMAAAPASTRHVAILHVRDGSSFHGFRPRVTRRVSYFDRGLFPYHVSSGQPHLHSSLFRFYSFLKWRRYHLGDKTCRAATKMLARRRQ